MKNKLPILRAWLVNVLILVLLRFTLLPYMVNRVVTHLPNDAGFAVIGIFIIEVVIVLVFMLVLASIILVILFSKILHLKHYIIYALLPQLAIGLFAWLSQYHWWPSIDIGLEGMLTMALLLLGVYFLLSSKFKEPTLSKNN